MNQLNAATIPTPTPSEDWINLPVSQRCARAAAALQGMASSRRDTLKVLDCKDDGQVILRLLEPLCAGERGTLLLDAEDHLKATLDEGLVVWLEPLGDKSSLRKLRGIEVKS